MVRIARATKLCHDREGQLNCQKCTQKKKTQEDGIEVVDTETIKEKQVMEESIGSGGMSESLKDM